MGSHNAGSIIKNVPVLKFMGYNRVVVLLDGRPEEAKIGGSTNNYNGGQIYHITAPKGTVADIEIVDIESYLSKSKELECEENDAPIKSDPSDQEFVYYDKKHNGKVLIAKNIRIL